MPNYFAIKYYFMNNFMYFKANYWNYLVNFANLYFFTEFSL